MQGNKNKELEDTPLGLATIEDIITHLGHRTTDKPFVVWGKPEGLIVSKEEEKCQG